MEEHAAGSERGGGRAAVAARTDRGLRRAENQDTFLVGELSEESSGGLLRPGSGDEDGAAAAMLSPGERGMLLVVADGMGGAAGGRLASGLACSFILAELREGWRSDARRTADRFVYHLTDAVEKASRRIHDHARRNPECAGMGTTVTVAGVLDDAVYIAQVGDSRAYLVRDGVATQLTRDQSVVQRMVESGVLTPEQAERSAHGHLVLQAVGVEPEVAVEVTTQELCAGDSLLLCSDGLYRLVSAEEMATLIDPLAEPAQACEELVALANRRGGPDNVTVLLARLDGVGPPP